MAAKFHSDNVYVIDKPLHKRTAAYDKWWIFEVKERNGNNIIFKSRERLDLKDYKGKILTSPKTGNEISFITIGMQEYMVDAGYNMPRGHRLSELSNEERLELLATKVEAEFNDEKQDFEKTEDCGLPLGEFLAQKAEKKL